jgi:hypothetical protein
MQDRSSDLRTQPLAPILAGNGVGHFHFLPPHNCPGQQAAAADKFASGFVDSGPQAQFGIFGMAVQKPFQLFQGFGQVAGRIRDVFGYLRVTVKREQVVEISGHLASEQEPLGFKNNSKRLCHFLFFPGFAKIFSGFWTRLSDTMPWHPREFVKSCLNFTSRP